MMLHAIYTRRYEEEFRVFLTENGFSELQVISILACLPEGNNLRNFKEMFSKLLAHEFTPTQILTITTCPYPQKRLQTVIDITPHLKQLGASFDQIMHLVSRSPNLETYQKNYKKLEQDLLSKKETALSEKRPASPFDDEPSSKKSRLTPSPNPPLEAEPFSEKALPTSSLYSNTLAPHTTFYTQSINKGSISFILNSETSQPSKTFQTL